LASICWYLSAKLYGVTSQNVFKKWDGEVWTGLIWLRTGTGGGGDFECGNEHSDPIKCGSFLASWLTVSFSGMTVLRGVHLGS